MTNFRSTTERLADAGLPYKAVSPSQVVALIRPVKGVSTVLAYTDEGVFAGYFPADTFAAKAAKVARMRGVFDVVVPTQVEVF